MINIEEMKKRICESDPSLAIYMVRDTPEVAEAGLLDLAWALCQGDCHKNDALGFFDLLEAHLKRTSDVMSCGHPLAESYQGEDGRTYCRICESA
jgi:hypothetical protein